MTDIQTQSKHEKNYREFLNGKFLFAAAIVGLASAGFSFLVDKAFIYCHMIFNYGGYWMLLFTPVIFVITVFLLKKFFPYSDGSGLPQGYAIDVFSEEELKKYYSIRTAIGKAILTFMSILGGASLGKEGPTIQICSSIFAQIKDVSLEKKRLLIKLASGVGVAAAFNTPIGGMIFAIEEYVRKISARSATMLVGGTLIAVLISNYFSGGLEYMGTIPLSSLHHGFNIGYIALLIGIICGLGGALFTKIIVFVSVNNTWFINRWRKNHYLMNALIFGLIVAIIGYLTTGLSFGNGAHATKYFLDNNIQAPWYYGVGKFFGAVSSVAAGVPGGYFSTALSIGAGIGDLVHHFLPNIPLIQFYLLGMVGFLASITQSPITATAMVVEMSNTSEFAMPILIAAFIASMIAEHFGDSVYHQQVLKYIPKEKYHLTR
ncbi:MAG: chloride channel protein [Burkholderiales bacterium]|nr:chloride channel protein [Burkholderiales bacterium]